VTQNQFNATQVTWNYKTQTHKKLGTYTVSQKTSPTFSTVTLKPIIKFLKFLVGIFLTQLAIKW